MTATCARNKPEDNPMRHRKSLSFAIAATLLAAAHSVPVQATETTAVEPKVLVSTTASSSRAGSIGIRVSVVPRPTTAQK